MAPKKQTKPTKRDADEELLAAQEKLVAVENAKLEAAAKAEAAKAAKRAQEAAKQAAEKLAAKAKIAAAHPPIHADDVASAIVKISQVSNWTAVASSLGATQAANSCWVSYVLNNFLMLVVESRERRVHIRTAAAPDGEPIESFAVHDDPNDNHSWNVFTTASGRTYCIDMTLDQFLPSGKYGYKRDADTTEGWVPVEAPSRLLLGDDARLMGTVAMDGGILPAGGVTTLTEGIPEGAYRTYLRFLGDAAHGRYSKMKPSEKRTAEILFKTKSVPQWLELHERLVAEFLS